MITKKQLSFQKSGWTSLAIILCTGILELISPKCVFLSWGYMAGILLALLSENRRDIAISIILSIVFVSVSFLREGNEETWEMILLTRIYALLGLFLMAYFVVRYLKRELNVANEKKLMAGIFSHGTQGIILAKATGEIVMVNPFAEELFGFPPNALVGKNCNNLLVYPSAKEAPLLEQLSVRPEKLVAFHHNEVEFAVEVSANKYESGGESYVVLFIIDITQRNADEEKILQQKRELEIVNQQLESFSYSVSHDLRSPLRAVGGYAQILEEDYGAGFDEEANRLLRNIQNNAKRMGLLIDDLLTFSRLGRKEVNKSMINIKQITQNVISQIEESTGHHAEIKVDPLPVVMADPSLIGQVITNLLSNAIKYSSKNKAPKIHIRFTETDSDITICVNDNGVGFDMKYVHKLFGVFQRLHLGSEFEGTGVGLAIAHRIIQKHGGAMRAEGEEGVGASFYFSLPKTQRDTSTQANASKHYELETTRFLG